MTRKETEMKREIYRTCICILITYNTCIAPLPASAIAGQFFKRRSKFMPNTRAGYTPRLTNSRVIHVQCVNSLLQVDLPVFMPVLHFAIMITIGANSFC